MDVLNNFREFLPRVTLGGYGGCCVRCPGVATQGTAGDPRGTKLLLTLL